MLYTMEKRQAKRRKVFGEDRLSDLHDPLLTHILSFLPVKEAAMTCVLSKQWRSTWSSVPDLDFTLNGPTDVDLVQNVLSRRTDNIRRFSLVLPQSYRGPPLTDRFGWWVERALECNARHVKIEMQHDETEVVFLDTLLEHEPLESLELDLFMPDSLLDDDSPVELDTRVRLSKLRALDLHIHGKVCSESLNRLISNCPVLEELQLYGWFDVLHISSCSLKKLHVEAEACSELRFSCPKLESERSAFMDQVTSNIPSACKVQIL